MRWIAWLFLLSPALLADEGDAGTARAERWAHPRGPASGSGRSYAEPPHSFGGILWSHKTKKAILCPPVTWDGVAFLCDGTAKSMKIVAVDVETGVRLARATVKGAGTPRPAAYDNAIFILEGGRKLVQRTLSRKSLVRRWSFTTPAPSSPPRIFEGEIYLATGGGLLRLRAGHKREVWKAAGDYRGEPAIYGDHVYALRRESGGALILAVHERMTGKEVSRCPVRDSADAARGGRVSVARGIVVVWVSPVKDSTRVLISRKLESGVPKLEKKREQKLLTQPLILNSIALALTEKERAWSILRFGERKVSPLVSKKDRPELIVGAPSCTQLDGTICFGTWAADVNGNHILWHLDERADTKVFKKGLRFGAVPAGDEILLVVTRDGKAVHAIGPEEIGS